MRKFVVIYYRVDDEAALESFYAGTHLRLLEQLPGLSKIEISRVANQPTGQSRFFLMVEGYWPTTKSMESALVSAPGLQLMDALRVWADNKLIVWFYADAFEEAKPGD